MFDFSYLPQAMAGSGFEGAANPVLFDNTVAPVGGAPINIPGNMGMNPNGTPVTSITPTWQDTLMKGLQNYGLMSEIAKMGMGMMGPNNIMKPIAAGAANIGTIVQYNDAMKKAGLSIPGVMSGGGTGTLGTTGSLTEPGAATGGSSSLTGSPSTGLSGADVIGLPLPAVKGIYDTAFSRSDAMHKRGMDEANLLLHAISATSGAESSAAYAAQARQAAESGRIRTEKEQKLEQNWNGYVEGLKNGTVPKPKGVDDTMMPFLAAIDPAHGTQFIDTIIKAGKTNNRLSFHMDDKYIYGMDPETGAVKSQFPISKDSHTKDPTLVASVQLDAQKRVTARVLADLDKVTAANPPENAKIQQLLKDMQVNPAGNTANFSTVMSMALKYPEVAKKMVGYQAAYNAAIAQGKHPSMVDELINSGGNLPTIPGPGVIPEGSMPPDAKAAFDFYKANEPKILASLKSKPAGLYPIIKGGVTYYFRWDPKTGRATLEYNPNIPIAKEH